MSVDRTDTGRQTPTVPRREAPPTRRTSPARPPALPATFEPYFWHQLDRRSGTAREVARRVRLLREHARAEKNYPKELLADRAAFLSIVLETMETEAERNGVFNVNAWTQAVNALTGLLRSLGGD